jgi:hypothetical protein
MATSVQLKACGGIPPYTWEATGGLVLSNDTGIHTTVSVGQACVTFNLSFCAQILTLCTTGECENFKVLCGVPLISATWEDGNGDEGNCSMSHPSGHPNYTVNCSPLCTGTVVVDNTGSCVPVGGTCEGLEVAVDLDCDSYSVTIDNDDFVVGFNTYELAAGFQGGTVTVTDWTGISATYVF